jgi:hypothetical protein
MTTIIKMMASRALLGSLGARRTRFRIRRAGGVPGVAGLGGTPGVGGVPAVGGMSKPLRSVSFYVPVDNSRKSNITLVQCVKIIAASVSRFCQRS